MRPLLLLLALSAFAACGDGATEAAPAEAAPADTRREGDSLMAARMPSVFPHGPYHYTCADGRTFEALFSTADSVRVTLDDGRTLALRYDASGGSGRFTDGTATAAFQGATTGAVEEGGRTTYADCRRTGA